MPKLPPALTPTALDALIREFKKSTLRKQKISDGGCKALCLFLQKNASGISKRWMFRRLPIERSLYGLTYPECSLAKARIMAGEYLESLNNGIDPLEEKKRQDRENAEAEQEAQKNAYTFRKAAADWMQTAIKADRWANNSKGERHTDSYLRRYILPVIGDVPINELRWSHVYDVMTYQDMIQKHPENAAKCRSIINYICLAAHTNGYRDADDEPARLVGALKNKLDLICPNKKQKGHKARVEPDDIPEFFAQIGEFNGMSARMLEFTILTAARPGMVQKSKHKDSITGIEFTAAASWKDIDLEAGTWTLSPDVMKMKGREEFVVYLSSYAIELLKSLPRFDGCPWVFTRDGVRPIGEGAMAALIDSMNAKRRALGLREWIDEKESRRIGRPVNVSPHGTARSSFRTWLMTDKHKNYQRFSRDAAELCLAHFIDDGFEGGYYRPDLTDARRECMEAWGKYCTTGLYPDE